MPRRDVFAARRFRLFFETRKTTHFFFVEEKRKLFRARIAPRPETAARPLFPASSWTRAIGRARARRLCARRSRAGTSATKTKAKK
jgi:hypothetical protein